MHETVDEIVGIFLLESIIICKCLENDERHDVSHTHPFSCDATFIEEFSCKFDLYVIFDDEVGTGYLKRR